MNGPIILHQLVHPSLLIGGGGGARGDWLPPATAENRDGIRGSFHAEMQFPSLFGYGKLQSTR